MTHTCYELGDLLMLRFQSPILRCSFGRNRLASLAILILPVLYSTRNAFSLETLTLALPAKSFQQIIYPLAQERGLHEGRGDRSQNYFYGTDHSGDGFRTSASCWMRINNSTKWAGSLDLDGG